MFVIFGTQHHENFSFLYACITSHLALLVLLHYLRIRYQVNRHTVFLWVGCSEKIVG